MGPKWLARSCNALNEKLFVVQVGVRIVVEIRDKGFTIILVEQNFRFAAQLAAVVAV